jgi:hypothetical protein
MGAMGGSNHSAKALASRIAVGNNRKVFARKERYWRQEQMGIDIENSSSNLYRFTHKNT